MAPRTKRSDRNSLVTPCLNTRNVRADTAADQFADRIAAQPIVQRISHRQMAEFVAKLFALICRAWRIIRAVIHISRDFIILELSLLCVRLAISPPLP